MKKEIEDLVNSFSGELQYTPKPKLKRMAAGGTITGGSNIGNSNVSYNELTMYAGVTDQLLSSFNEQPQYDTNNGGLVSSLASSSGPIGGAIGAVAGTLESVGDLFNDYNQYGYNTNETAGYIDSFLGNAFNQGDAALKDVEEGDWVGAGLNFALPGFAGAFDYEDEQKAALQKEQDYNTQLSKANATKGTAKINAGLNSSNSNRGQMNQGIKPGYYNRAKGGSVPSSSGISKLNGGNGKQDSIKLGDIAMVDDGEVKFGNYIFSNVLEYGD